MGNVLFKECGSSSRPGLGLPFQKEVWEPIEPSNPPSSSPPQKEEEEEKVASVTSMELYPPRIRGMNPPYDIPAATDELCDRIDDAVRGWGTDERALISLLAPRPASERYEIWTRYRQLHRADAASDDGGGKGRRGRKPTTNLEDTIRSECGDGDMGFALQLLAMPPDMADARILYQAMRGCGTRARHVYPILCGRSNAEIASLRRAYYEMYGHDLSVRLQLETSGDVRDFLSLCIQGVERTYEPGWHTPDRADRYATALYNAGQGRWGTNEFGVYKVILQSPPPHLRNVNESYRTKYGRTILQVLDSELTGQAERAVVYAAGMKLSPFRTVARQVRIACSGFGTDEFMLTSLVIRYQSMLKGVDKAHREMYQDKSLAERIEEETCGLYKFLLLEVIKAAV